MRYLAIFLMCCSSLVYGYSKDYIPPNAFSYKETIQKELDSNFSSLYDYNYVPSLIEHESCISLKHSRCWKSTSELRTKRELGIGLGQLTKAYKADGSIRFDTLTEMRNKYKSQLKELSWDTLKNRPDLQIRVIVLMLRDMDKSLYSVKNSEYRTQMVDSAYNGGLGGLQKERRACGLAKGCDPQQWFGHVEKYCLKSKKVLYGVRSSCDINRDHVFDVWNNRLPKYRKQYFIVNKGNV